jgi:hypothetical protein
MIALISQKTSLLQCCKQKYKWGKENYIDSCIINERIIWPKKGILKLRKTRKEYERGRCPLSA